MNIDDLEPGATVAEQTFEDVDACSMKLVTAIFRDPNPIHYDREYAEDQGFPGRVSQGPLNASYVTQTVLSIVDGPQDLRALDVRYEDFVFEGETVTATATVDRVHETNAESRLDLTLELCKEDGTTALTGTATVSVAGDTARDEVR